MEEEDYIQIKITIPSLRSFIHPGYKDDKNLVLSKRENEVLDECENHANIYYSLPLSIICGSAMFVAQKKKWISKLRETNIKWLQKLPHFPFRNRTLHGIIFGYTIGQLLYVLSSDCEDRFLKDAPDGDVAKLIREEQEGNKNSDDRFNSRVIEEKLSNIKSQSKSNAKDDILDIDPDTHSTYLTDYSDVTSVDWFGKCEIDLPENPKDGK